VKFTEVLPLHKPFHTKKTRTMGISTQQNLKLSNLDVFELYRTIKYEFSRVHTIK